MKHKAIQTLKTLRYFHMTDLFTKLVDPHSLNPLLTNSNTETAEWSVSICPICTIMQLGLQITQTYQLILSIPGIILCTDPQSGLDLCPIYLTARQGSEMNGDQLLTVIKLKFCFATLPRTAAAVQKIDTEIKNR